MKIPCHLNLAICYHKQKEYSHALHFAKKAADIDPANAKALYRVGMA
jgi:tetratricopeptide (TPR) repeat protein